MALILLIPFRIVQAPISLVNAITHSWWDRRTCYTIAVAGLDESKAQPLTYTLRRAASTDEVGVGNMPHVDGVLPDSPNHVCRRRRY